MRQFLVVGAFVLAGLLAGCHSPRSEGAWGGATLDDVTAGLEEAPSPPEAAAMKTAFARTQGGEGGASFAPAEPVPAKDRLLIQRGQIRVEVPRPDDVAREFLAKVVAWGGYLQSQQDMTLTVRLPAAKFDEAFAAVRAFGRVIAESRQADDVTEEFVDLGIRLDTARKSRDRLLEILQKADKVEDILKVEAELRRLTEEIERMEGRRKFLADQVALATLQVSLQATADAPRGKRTRQRSRFEWINRVGAEAMMGDF